MDTIMGEGKENHSKINIETNGNKEQTGQGNMTIRQMTYQDGNAMRSDTTRSNVEPARKYNRLKTKRRPAPMTLDG